MENNPLKQKNHIPILQYAECVEITDKKWNHSSYDELVSFFNKRARREHGWYI